MQGELLTPLKQDFIKVWARQKYLIQELAHQCNVRNCMAHRMSSTFSSNLVVPIIKVGFKYLCDHEVRYLDLMYFSELWHSKETVKHFVVAVFINLALQEMVKCFLVAVQRTHHV
jgi:hypothetical protein